MKTTLYLIQTAKGLPELYQCLKAKNYLILSYKEQTEDTTIFAPNTTWTQGRNLLYQYVRDHNLQYDYYVFMDEDVMFKKSTRTRTRTHIQNPHPLLQRINNAVKNQLILGKTAHFRRRQAAGFSCLEATFEAGNYPLVTLRYAYAAYTKEMTTAALAQDVKKENLMWLLPAEIIRKGVVSFSAPLISLNWFDAMLNAFSKEVFFADTVLPYAQDYDAESWWISQAILMLKAHYYYPEQIIQNNQYTMFNTQASAYPRGGETHEEQSRTTLRRMAKEYQRLCKENGVTKMPFSEGIEIKPQQPLPPASSYLRSTRWEKMTDCYEYLLTLSICGSRLLRRVCYAGLRKIVIKLNIHPLCFLRQSLIFREIVKTILKHGSYDIAEFWVMPEKKLLYFNNCKVACSSIKSTFFPDQFKQSDEFIGNSLARYAEAYPQQIHSISTLKHADKDYFKFTFVRNPFSRLVSCYVDKIIRGDYHFKHYLFDYLQQQNGLARMSFDDFVKRIIRIPHRFAEEHFRSQHYHIVDWRGRSRLDFIGKFENLAAEFAPIQEKYSLESMPHLGNSQSGNWMDYYTLESAKLVRKRYQKDLEYFGYENAYAELIEYLNNKPR